MFAPRVVAAGRRVRRRRRAAVRVEPAHALAAAPAAARPVVDALQTFWFDVTKSDWRDTMVMTRAGQRGWVTVGRDVLVRPRGSSSAWPGRSLAIVGLAAPGRERVRRGVLLSIALRGQRPRSRSATTSAMPTCSICRRTCCSRCSSRRPWRRPATLGDAHGPATAGPFWRPLSRAPRASMSTTTPRSIAATTSAPGALVRRSQRLDDRHDVLLDDLNWQVQNGLSYVAKVTRPGLAYARLPDVLLYAPALVADNLRHRPPTSWLTARAPATLSRPRTVPLLRRETRPARDRHEPGRQPSDRLPPGTRYALCVLKPTQDFTLDADDLSARCVA